MHFFRTSILIYDVFYMFQTRAFIFRQTAAHTGMVWNVYHASV